MRVGFRSFVLFMIILMVSLDSVYSQRRPKDRILDKKEFAITLENNGNSPARLHLKGGDDK